MPEPELRELRDALGGDERARVVELVDPLVEAFDERRDRENEVSTIARHLDAAAPSGSDGESTAMEALQAAREAGTARTQLTTTLAGYLNEQRDVTTALEAADAAIAASKAFESVAELTHDAADDAALPPLLFLSGPDTVQLPKGTDLDVELTLKNAGSAVAEAVSVDVSSPIDASVTPTDVGTLDGGATTTLRLVGTPSTTETTTVNLVAEGNDVVSSLDADVTVISRLGYLRRTASRFDDLLSDIERIRVGDDNRGDGWLRGRREEVTSLKDRLERVIERTRNGDTSDQERRIRRLREQLEKLRERIERKARRSDSSDRRNGSGDREKQEIPPADARLLVDDVTAISATLERSLHAAL